MNRIKLSRAYMREIKMFARSSIVGPTETPAGRLEGILGQHRAARGDGPDPNADVPGEDNWR